MEPGADDFAGKLVEFRELAQSRMSHRQYYEVMLMTYHKAIWNTVVEKGLITGKELHDGLNKHFDEAIANMKNLPMISPIQK